MITLIRKRNIFNKTILTCCVKQRQPTRKQNHTKTKKIVIATSGGFSLTEKAIHWLLREHGIENPDESDLRIGLNYGLMMDGKTRQDDILVRMVEELCGDASTPGCMLEVVKIPEDIDYTIKSMNYWGDIEYIVERHRTWWGN